MAEFHVQKIVGIEGQRCPHPFLDVSCVSRKLSEETSTFFRTYRWEREGRRGRGLDSWQADRGRFLTLRRGRKLVF